ncbi:MAG: FAD-binding oxidoreductase [Gammaproteobacteria bacterium]
MDKQLHKKVRAVNIFRFFHSRSRVSLSILLMLLIFSVRITQAGVSPEEHNAHHPGPPSMSQQDSASSLPGPATAPGPMEAMGEMMRNMGVPPPKEIYPSLMTLAVLTQEKREEVESAANERMASGTELMTDGLNRLADSVATDDYETIQQAVDLLHEGMARFESGLAAHRALSGIDDPQAIALDWFRREMELPGPVSVQKESAILGVSWFHFWIMFSSIVFIAGFLWIYFLKMRRASQLLHNLTEINRDDEQGINFRLAEQPDSQPEKILTAVPRHSGKRWSGQLRVGRIFQETADVKTFRLMNPAGGFLPFDFLPGQFITVAVSNNGSIDRRSYTIASSPTQRDYIEITVKLAPEGQVSGHLHTKVQEGDLLDLSGPSGSLVFTGRECKCILLIGGGVGITPLMSVLRYLTDRSWDGDIFLIYGCRSPADIIFREELDYLQRRHANLHVVITVGQSEGTEWSGQKGHITKDLIVASVPDLPTRYIHICGPVPMMEATKQLLADLGVPTDRIKTEAFGPALGKQERTPKADQNVNLEGLETTAEELSTVTFTDSNKAGQLSPDKVVLDVAEDLGVDIDFSCRSGVCGLCRVELLAGKVSMAVEDGLQPGDKEKNIILACQAKASGDILVKA